ncbi:MAG: thioredoxin domain-containing protein [Desulfobulbaceae bacterium]|jgi:protein-disulfide isomerase|nr:thioredoxin domain-containing protein [Desulfobulbaceae bacterium]
MRYSPLLTVGIFVLLFGPLAALADPPADNKTGRDGSVEWSQSQEWKIEGQPLDVAHSLDGRLVYILNNKKQVLVYTSDSKLLGKVAVEAGVDAIDIAPTARGESLYLTNKRTGTFTTLAMNFVYKDIDMSGAPFKGPDNAPVTIIVFTDFQCPYCIRLEPLLNQVFEKNQDKVKMVFKNFPLPMHPMAEPAHRAAWAAGQQGKFWEFHDRIFKSQLNSQQQLNQALIETTAKDLGLNMERFKADMELPAAKDRIVKDITDGEKAQVMGTPTVFINGRKPQERSLEFYQRMIDEELGKSGR